MSDLKPCPFCSNRSPQVQSNDMGDWYVICRSDDLDDTFCEAKTSDRNCESREQAITAWNRRAAIAAVEAEGWQLVPVDDAAFNLSDTSLPWPMVDAGIKALEQVNEDDLNYEAGVTTCWDMGMVAVAVYRAMLAAAPKPDADHYPSLPLTTDGWKTMDSAPRTGELLDLWVTYKGDAGCRVVDCWFVENKPCEFTKEWPDGSIHVIGRGARSGWYAKEINYGEDDWIDDGGITPTHWRHQPAAPEVE